MTDEERLLEIRHQWGSLSERVVGDVHWLIDRVWALTAELAHEKEAHRLTGRWWQLMAVSDDQGYKALIETLTAERDALLVDRDAWKARCLGHTPAAKEER